MLNLFGAWGDSWCCAWGRAWGPARQTIDPDFNEGIINPAYAICNVAPEYNKVEINEENIICCHN